MKVVKSIDSNSRPPNGLAHAAPRAASWPRNLPWSLVLAWLRRPLQLCTPLCLLVLVAWAVTLMPGASSAIAVVGDADLDGVPDEVDVCRAVFDPDQLDLDTDGVGDACDPDIDGDAVPNAADAFPFDASESVDSDGDGFGDVADTDDDNDGVCDGAEDGCSQSRTACGSGTDIALSPWPSRPYNIPPHV